VLENVLVCHEDAEEISGNKLLPTSRGVPEFSTETEET
jgi:hypothetical protein